MTEPAPKITAAHKAALLERGYSPATIERWERDNPANIVTVFARIAKSGQVGSQQPEAAPTPTATILDKAELNEIRERQGPMPPIKDPSDLNKDVELAAERHAGEVTRAPESPTEAAETTTTSASNAPIDHIGAGEPPPQASDDDGFDTFIDQSEPGAGEPEQADERVIDFKKAKAKKAKTPPPPPEQDEKTIEAILIGLAELSELAYQRRRVAAAKSIGLTVGVLDKLVKQRRAEFEAAKLPALFPYWKVELWPEPVNGRMLILSLVGRIRSHVVMSPESALVCALWIIMAWAHKEVAVHSPILMVTSAEAECGKSTLLGVLGFLVPRALASVGISPAVLYRSIEIWSPTLSVDEADAIFIQDEELRAVYNSGWTRGQGVLRCEGDEHEPRLFSTFCPKILGLKGKKLPDTTLSRAIIVELKRRLAAEAVGDFQHIDDKGFADLRRQLLCWVTDNVGALRRATPTMPDGFENRRAANWRLMLAIADAIGGEWPDKARKAAEKLAGVTASNSIGVKLLADIRTIFDVSGADCLSSATLVAKLTADAESGWSEWRGGKPLTQRQLAGLLRPFGIVSGTIHPAGEPDAKGYQRPHFEDAFGRYLDPSTQKPTSDPSKRPNADSTATSDENRSVREGIPDGSKTDDLSHSHAGLDAWTDRKPDFGQDGCFERDEDRSPAISAGPGDSLDDLDPEPRR
jgi:hypothetical protein